MLPPRTLSRYVVREVAAYSLLGLLAITFVMVTQNLFRFLDDLAGARLTLLAMLELVSALAIMLATYTLPIAFLFGVVVAVSRLAADGEVVALFSCGVGFPRLIAPIAILGALVSALTAYLVIDVEHRAQLAARRAVRSLAMEGGFVTPGRFRHFDDRMLYVQSIGADDSLEGILISDRSDPARPLMIFAEHGRLDWDAGRSRLHFQLREGDIHLKPDRPGDHYHRIGFASFDYAIDATSVFGRAFSTLRPREMSMDQLRAIVARAEAGDRLDDLRRKDPRQYELQIHRRYALPVAPFLFAFVGGALGLSPRGGVRSWGALLCAALVFGYYAVLTFSEFLALRRLLPSGVAAWLVNVVFAAAAIALCWRAGRLRD